MQSLPNPVVLSQLSSSQICLFSYVRFKKTCHAEVVGCSDTDLAVQFAACCQGFDLDAQDKGGRRSDESKAELNRVGVVSLERKRYDNEWPHVIITDSVVLSLTINKTDYGEKQNE